MPKYIVDECSDSVAALQEALDYMSARGWKLTNSIWLPRRKIWVDGAEQDANAQYVLIFERDSTDGITGT